MEQEQAIERGRGDPWPGAIALGAVFLLSLFACLRKIWTVDFWWQLRTGQFVAEVGWPSIDVFSYTATGSPWIELRWLFCLAEYRLMQAVGPTGLTLTKWLVVVLAFTLISLPVLRRRNLVTVAAVLCVALLAASQRFYERPELVTYVMLGAFALALDRYRKGHGRWIWLLPLLQVLWVNSHPMFLLGPLMVGLLLVVEGTRLLRGRAGESLAETLRPAWPLAVVLSGTLLACLINPYGWGSLKLTWLLFSEMRGSIFRQAITELRSPFDFGSAYVAVTWFKVLIGLCAATVLWNLRRLDPFWTGLCAALLYVSSLSIRNLPLFCLAAVPFVVFNIDRSGLWERVRPEVWLPTARRVLAAAIVALCGWYALEMATDRFSLRQNDSNQFGVGFAEHRFPFRALEFIDRVGFEERLFGTLLEGSFLLAHDRQVFADPRLEVYGEELFGTFLAAHTRSEVFDAAVSEYDIRGALVDLRAPLVRRLARDRRWNLVYFDEVSALFVRGDALGNLEVIETAEGLSDVIYRLRQRLPRPEPLARLGRFQRVTLPEPYLSLADFLLMTGWPEAAAEWLEDAETASPYLPGLALRRVTLEDLRGNHAGVVEQALLALEETPDDPQLMLKLGEAHFRLGDADEALHWLTRSLDGLPELATTWYTLGRIHFEAQRPDEAERCLRRAVGLEPGSVLYRRNLGRLLALQGQPEEAIVEFEAAAALAPGDPSILADLVQLCLSRGEVPRARAYLERGLALAPDDMALRGLERLVEQARADGQAP